MQRFLVVVEFRHTPLMLIILSIYCSKPDQSKSQISPAPEIAVVSRGEYHGVERPALENVGLERTIGRWRRRVYIIQVYGEYYGNKVMKTMIPWGGGFIYFYQ